MTPREAKRIADRRTAFMALTKGIPSYTVGQVCNELTRPYGEWRRATKSLMADAFAHHDHYLPGLKDVTIKQLEQALERRKLI